MHVTAGAEQLRAFGVLVFLPLFAFPKCARASMAELYPSLSQCAIVAAALKVLLFPA